MSANDRGRGPQINPPHRDLQGTTEYLMECAFAVEPSLVTLIEAAADAGWGRKQIVLAIMIAVGDYFENSELQLDTDDLDFIGPGNVHTLN